MTLTDYQAFLEAKAVAADLDGFPCDESEVNPLLLPHQRAAVAWAVRGGCRALFESFGLGKTMQQLEIVRLILSHLEGGRGLIVMPLGVRGEFVRDAAKLGMTVRFVRTDAEASEPGIYLTNYETVRESKIDTTAFDVVSLDEAAILRGFGGTRTFRELMATMAGDDRRDRSNRITSEGIRFRFVATATPSPNAYIELLAYAAFLGIMDVSAAKTRFFKRDNEHADNLTLHPHKESEFYQWLASWALFINTPSDLGFSDEGYALPPLRVQWHEVESPPGDAGMRNDGQGRLLADAAIGVVDASREKRRSLEARVAKLMEVVPDDDQVVIWADLNDEQRAIEQALDARGISHSSLYGNQNLDVREAMFDRWRNGDTSAFVSKPSMYGAGVNLQQCHTMIFAGIGFRFHEFIQAIHRIHRFQQSHECTVHLITTEAEREVRATLERKWQQHNELVARMTEIIREHGLAQSAMASMGRAMGIERQEASGRGWTLVNNDAVHEAAAMEPDSVDLMLTSIPFSTQYEYSPNYADLGHTDDNAHFWRQMDYLTPNLLRVLKPGRCLVVHVKDRVTPGGINGFGFQTVDPFHCQAIAHYTRHGFAHMGMHTVVTDVVRENSQTYRLGWSEQCKDGTKMGCGQSEYLLLFRKPPTDPANGYADEPVVKDKAEYSRARWQTDAHGFWRSSGNRLISPEDVRHLPHERIYKMFRAWSESSVYDYEHHVALGETLEREKWLPTGFMLLQPASWDSSVWTDVARMRSLNTYQAGRNREGHLCPLPFDIVDRVIRQMSMPGELVLDPFVGIGTTVFSALKLGRKGYGVELSESYWQDAMYWCRRAEQEAATPTLFDLLDAESSPTEVSA